jgi:hypothetical protein
LSIQECDRFVRDRALRITAALIPPQNSSIKMRFFHTQHNNLWPNGCEIPTLRFYPLKNNKGSGMGWHAHCYIFRRIPYRKALKHGTR